MSEQESQSADHGRLPALGPLVEPPPRPVWPKLVYGGVGCLVLIVLVIGATVAWNARWIASALRAGAVDLAELSAVRDKLVTRYGTADVTVLRMSPGSSGDDSARRLVVRMANPPFLKQTKLEDAEAIAREIASVARGVLKDPSSAPRIDVVIEEKSGFGVTFAKNRTFSFAADELIGGR